jgi:hypothetical protein
VFLGLIRIVKRKLTMNTIDEHKECFGLWDYCGTQDRAKCGELIECVYECLGKKDCLIPVEPEFRRITLND